MVGVDAAKMPFWCGMLVFVENDRHASRRAFSR
jgi:hypothetical protein